MKHLQRISAVISIFGICSRSAALIEEAVLNTASQEIWVRESDSIAEKMRKTIALLTQQQQALDRIPPSQYTERSDFLINSTQNLYLRTALFPLIQIYEESYTSLQSLKGFRKERGQGAGIEEIVNQLFERRIEIVVEWLQCKVDATEYQAKIERLSRLLDIEPYAIRDYALQCALFLTHNPLPYFDPAAIDAIVSESLNSHDAVCREFVIIKLLLIADEVSPQFKDQAVAVANAFTRETKVSNQSRTIADLGHRRAFGRSYQAGFAGQNNEVNDLIILFPGCINIEDGGYMFLNGFSSELLGRCKMPPWDLFYHDKYEFVSAYRAYRMPQHKVTSETILQYRKAHAEDLQKKQSADPISSSSNHSDNLLPRRESSKVSLTAKLLVGSAAIAIIAKILYHYNLRAKERAKVDISLKSIEEILSNNSHLIKDLSDYSH